MTNPDEWTKQELYDEITAHGRKLTKGVNKYTKQELADILDEINAQAEGKVKEAEEQIAAAKAEKAEKQEHIGLLRFDSAGWCNELCVTYDIGLYRPKSVTEYNILKHYAAEEVQ